MTRNLVALGLGACGLLLFTLRAPAPLIHPPATGNITSNSVALIVADGVATAIATATAVPSTVAWASDSITVGWPTLYYTHSITSNSWVTGYAGGVAGKVLTAFLTITNATASDLTLSVSNAVNTTDGLRSWTVTNKTSRGFSFKVGTQTNAASAPLY